jgi:hypothetical protein
MRTRLPRPGRRRQAGHAVLPRRRAQGSEPDDGSADRMLRNRSGGNSATPIPTTVSLSSATVLLVSSRNRAGGIIPQVGRGVKLCYFCEFRIKRPVAWEVAARCRSRRPRSWSAQSHSHFSRPLERLSGGDRLSGVEALAGNWLFHQPRPPLCYSTTSRSRLGSSPTE